MSCYAACVRVATPAYATAHGLHAVGDAEQALSKTPRRRARCAGPPPPPALQVLRQVGKAWRKELKAAGIAQLEDKHLQSSSAAFGEFLREQLWGPTGAQPVVTGAKGQVSTSAEVRNLPRLAGGRGGAHMWRRLSSR